MSTQETIAQLKTDTAALAMREGRRVGRPGHEVARGYLLERMKNVGLEPFSDESLELWFGREEGRGEQDSGFCNLVGVVPGRDRTKPPILVGAHFDSVIDAPCADDNATAVAVALAVAHHFASHSANRSADHLSNLQESGSDPNLLRGLRKLASDPEGSDGSDYEEEDRPQGPGLLTPTEHERSPRAKAATEQLSRDLVIALFDSEEPPYFLGPEMGSIRFVEDNCEGKTFACAIIMDLVGHDVEVGVPGIEQLFPGLAELLFVTGCETDGRLTQVVAAAAEHVENLRVFPTLNDYVGDMSDHHAFRVAGHPFLFLSCGQGRFYHHPQDDLDWINFEKLERVFEFVCGLVIARDQAADGLVQPSDPVSFELEMIDKAFGGRMELLLAALGVEKLETRRDIDRLAGVFRDRFVV